MSQRAPGTLLIVDDEAIIRDSLRQWLEMEGFRVFTAENGDRALQLCKFEELDVGIFDIRMPGMDGITLLSRTRICRPEMDVIMMTAFASIEDAVRCMSEGAHDYIIKPFPPEKLSKSIHHLLEARKLHAAQRDLISQQGMLNRFFDACTPFLALGTATAALSGPSWAGAGTGQESEQEPALLRELVDRALAIGLTAQQASSRDLRTLVETALLLADMQPDGRSRPSLAASAAGERPAGLPSVPAILALQLLFDHLIRNGHTDPLLSLEVVPGTPARTRLSIGLRKPLSERDRALLLARQEGSDPDAARLRLAVLLLRLLDATLTFTPRREEGETILITFPSAAKSE